VLASPLPATVTSRVGSTNEDLGAVVNVMDVPVAPSTVAATPSTTTVTPDGSLPRLVPVRVIVSLPATAP